VIALSGDFEARPEEAMDSGLNDCKALTLPSVEDESKFAQMGAGAWFHENQYDPITDMLFEPPAIWVPEMDEKLLLGENQRLSEEFKVIDFQNISRQFVEHLMKKEFKEAAAMLGPDLAKRTAKLGLVGLMKHDLKRNGLGQVAVDWPDKKNDLKPHPFNKWTKVDKWVGNNMVILKIPVTLNGTEVVLSLKYVHSRGSAVFDLDISFNADYLKTEGHQIGHDRKPIE